MNSVATLKWRLIVLICICLCGFGTGDAFGQIAWGTLGSENLSKCSSEGLFSIEVNNTTLTAHNSVSLVPVLPAGVSVVSTGIIDSSSFVTGGIAWTGTAFVISNPVPSAGKLKFFFKLRASCAASSGSIFNTYSYRIAGIATGTTATSTTYSINGAVLSISALTNSSKTGVNIGDTFTQCATVVNGGVGTLDSFTLNLDSTGVGFSNITITGGSSGSPAYFLSNAGRLTVYPASPLPFNGSVQICYTVTVRRCLSTSRNLSASWGCSGSVCQTGNIVSSGFTVSSTAPTVAAICRESGAAASCITGLVRNFDAVVKNTGSVPILPTKLIFGNSTDGNGPIGTWETAVLDTGSIVVRVYRSGVPTAYTSATIGAIGASAAVEYSNTIAAGNCANGKPGIYSLTWPSGSSFMVKAGDSIVVSYTKTQCDNSAAGCSFSGMVLSNFFSRTPSGYYQYLNATRIIYTDQCGGSSNTVSSITANQTSYNLSAAITNANAPSQVVGSSRFRVSGSANFSNYVSGSPRGYSQVDIQVPAGVIYVDSTLSLIPAACDAPNSLIPGYPLFLKGAGAGGTNILRFRIAFPAQTTAFSMNASSWSASFKDTGSTCASANITQTVSVAGDTACPGYAIVVHCVSSSVSFVCPVSCSSTSPLSSYDSRISRGKPDSDNNCFPDVSGSLDTNKISTNYFIPTDTLRSYVKYVVFTDATHPSWNLVQADYQFSQGKWRPAGNARIRLTRGTSRFDIAATITTVDTTAQNFVLTWDALKPGSWGKYLAGDTVEVEQDFEWTDNPLALPYGQTNFSVSGVLKKTVYAAQTTPALGIWTYNGPDKFSCLTINYSYNLTGYTAIETYFIDSVNGCNAQASLNVIARTNGNMGYSFPYEFRATQALDSFVINIPSGMSYNSLLSASLPFRDASGSAPTVAQINSFTTVRSNAVVFRIKDMADTLGFRSYEFARGTSVFVNVKLDPSQCMSGTNTIQSFTYSRLLRYSKPLRSTDSSLISSATGFIYSNLKPQISTTVTAKSSNTGTDSFTLVFGNPHLSKTLDNAWINLKSVLGGISITGVRIAGALVPPNAGGFYSLGSLSPSSSKNIVINTKLTSCTTDSIVCYYGASCTALPASLSATNCKDSLYLKLMPVNSGVQAVVYPLNSGANYNFCNPFFNELDINSTSLGDVKNVSVDVILPPGVTYVPGSVKFKFPSTASAYTTATYNPVVSGSSLHFDITASPVMTSVLSTDSLLTGVYDATRNNVRLQFQVVTKCGANEGAALFYNFNAKAACGTAIPGFTLNSRSLTFADVSGLGYATFLGNCYADTVRDCKVGNKLLVSVVNLGPSRSSALDSIRIVLPNTLFYAGYNIVSGALHNAPVVPPRVVIQSDGSSVLTWQLKDSVDIGDSIQFYFQVAPNTARSTWPSKSISVSTGRFVTKVCGTDTCLVFKTNGSAQVIPQILWGANIPLALAGASASIPVNYDCTDSSGTLSFFDQLSAAGKVYMKIRTNGNSGYRFAGWVSNDSAGTVNNSMKSNSFSTTALMNRMYTIKDSATTLYTRGGGMTVRLYYSTADSTAAVASLDPAVGATNPKFTWFKVSGSVKDVLALQTYSGFLGYLASVKFLTPARYGIESGLHYVEFDSINTFSTFGAIASSQAAVLPVHFLEYSVSEGANCSVLLKWLYANPDRQPQYYQVQRGGDGINYASVAVLGKNAMSYTDLPGNGNWYYRVMAQTEDSNRYYTPAQLIRLNECQPVSVNVKPNPARDQIYLSVCCSATGVGYNYTLIDIFGNVVNSGVLLEGGDALIDVRELARGAYVLMVNGEGLDFRAFVLLQ